jgi:hypothetical protein
MYTAADLALARRHIVEGERRLARMVALADTLALQGHGTLAREAAILTELMTVTLGHYQDHAKAISAAMSIQRREHLTSGQG